MEEMRTPLDLTPGMKGTVTPITFDQDPEEIMEDFYLDNTLSDDHKWSDHKEELGITKERRLHERTAK
jgi:hypothetical protein